MTNWAFFSAGPFGDVRCSSLNQRFFQMTMTWDLAQIGGSSKANPRDDVVRSDTVRLCVSGRPALITVMETTKRRNRNTRARFGRLHGAGFRAILLERQMCACPMVISAISRRYCFKLRSLKTIM